MRIQWIEHAKGLGILLVVFGHAWRGIEASGLHIPLRVFHAVDNAIYAFHMPLFFFLSGLVFLRTKHTSGLSVFVGTRVLRLLWPLVLWTWIFVGVKLIAGQAQNDAMHLSDFPILPLPPVAHFWFLWALFLLQIGMDLLLRALPLNWRIGQTRGLAGIAGVLAVLGIGVMPYAGPWLNAALIHLPYFLVGFALSGVVSWRVPAGLVAMSALVAGALIWAAMSGAWGAVHSLAIVLALCAALSGLAQWSGPLGVGRVFRALGEASLTIYLMHTIFSAAAREVLLALNVESIALHLIGGTAVGLLLPWLVYRGLRGRPAQVALGL